MGFRNLFTFLLLLIGVYGFSEAHYPYLASGTKGNYFDYMSEAAFHDQHYSPDYFDHGKRFGHFWPYGQSSSKHHLQNFNNHRYFHDLNSAELSKRLNHDYENHLLHQKSELEHQHINYHNTPNFPKHLDHFNYHGKSQQYNQQNNFDKLGNLHHLPFHNSENEYHLMNNQDYLNYLHQYQQFNYPGHYHEPYQQSVSRQYRNLRQPQLQPHNSSGEYRSEDNHDKLSYFNEFQQLNFSDKDQQLNQENEYRVTNQEQLHAGEHHQSDSHDKIGHANQFEQHNYSGSGQLDQKDNFKPPEILNQPKINNSVDEHQIVNTSNMENHPVQFQESNHSNMDHHFNQQGNTEQHSLLGDNQQHNGSAMSVTMVENYIVSSELPQQSSIDNSEHSHQEQVNNTGVPLQFNQSDPSEKHIHPSQQQQNGQELPSVEQKNMTSEPSEFINNILPSHYPHQPLNLDYESTNKEYGHLNDFQQLNNIGLDQQHDKRSFLDESRHVKELQLSRYSRDQQQIYRGNMVPVSALQNGGNIDPLHIPTNLQQVHQDQSDKIYYRNSPEKFDYSDLQQQNANPGQFGQFMDPSHFTNTGQLGKLMDPSHFSNPGQLGKLMDPSHFSNPGQLGKLMDPSHFRNPAQIGQHVQPSHFSNSHQFGKLMDPTHFLNPSQFGQLMNPSHFSNPSQFGQFMNPSHFISPDELEQHNNRNMFRRLINPNNPLQHSYSLTGYSKREDFRVPVAGDSLNEEYSFPEMSGQQDYLKQTNEHKNINATENAGDAYYRSNLQQFFNPANFWPFNQKIPFIHTENGNETQFRNYHEESQKPNNNNGNLPVSPTNVQPPEQQKQPNQAADSTEKHLAEQNSYSTQLQDHPDLTNQPNTLLPDQLVNLNETQIHSNSTEDQQLNYTSEPQNPNLQNESQHLNTEQRGNQQILPHLAEHLFNSSELLLSGNLSQFLSHVNPFKQDDFAIEGSLSTNLGEQRLSNDFTTHQQENNTGQSETTNSQNQSQTLNDQQIPNEQNSPNQTNEPPNSSGNNKTGDLSQLSEHIGGLVDQFQQNLATVNPFANGDEQQVSNNSANSQPQNHSDFSNSNGSVNDLKNSTSQQPDSNNREQRYLEFPTYPSPLQYFYRSNQPSGLNPFNQIDKTNFHMEPMDPYNHHQHWIENQDYKNFVPPSICYLEKIHGPCNGAVPSFFFNFVTKRCEQFIYGGCYGNANNFATLEECESICMIYPQNGFAETKYPQQWHFDNLKYEDPALPLWHPGPDLVHEFCSLDKKVGPCRAIFRRYFFNPVTKDCEEFIYGGCYGNANNFFTKEECEFVCKSY